VRIRLDRVSKRFAGALAVDSLSLDIEDRCFVSLLGPSGCGKTTTLRMIAGLEKPSTGAIYFDGARVDHLPANHRDIAMVFQSYALYPHLSVRDNIAFPLRMAGTARGEVDRRVRTAAERLALADLLDRKPRELSGGQRQRVALGRAIVREPGVFLMDEPLSNLDAQLRVEMRAELKRLHVELARTFVFVTHDQAEALTMSDVVAVLDGGVLQQVGTPDEIYHRPANITVARFIGSPGMNLIRGVLRRADGGTVFRDEGGEMQVPVPLSGTLESMLDREIVLGIRPEAISLNCDQTDSSLAGTVYVTEPLGSDLFVTARVGGALLKLRTEASRRLGIGDVVHLHLDPRRVHLFDANGGAAVALPPVDR
jgi:multiple sugar transport system ATP-binding protein